jgi:hypothetical protein
MSGVGTRYGVCNKGLNPSMYDKLDSACKRLHDPPLTCHLIDDCGIACWSQHDPETQLGGPDPGKSACLQKDGVD